MPVARNCAPNRFNCWMARPQTTDILDGVDTTWQRYANGAEIQRLIDTATKDFQPANASASVPILLQLHAKLAALPDDVNVQGQAPRIGSHHSKLRGFNG